MDDAVFIRHEPCPRCLSKDNMGLWSDGHKYCFGCGHYVPAPDTLEALKTRSEKQKEAKTDVIPTSILPCNSTNHIPMAALKWLHKYGITPHEIEHYGLCWNIDTESLVFPFYGKPGEFLFRQERYFGPKKQVPKYVTYGDKRMLPQIRNNLLPASLIFVEDFVSAMKVARVCTVSPLLGSNIPASAIKALYRAFKQVRVWLDLDKASDALREASKCLTVVQDVSTIITQLDPKEYSTEEISRIVLKSLHKFPTNGREPPAKAGV